MKHLSIIAFLILTLQTKSASQQMSLLGNSTIELNGYTYNFYESESLFSKPLTIDAYAKAMKSKRASKTWGYTSIAALGLGTALVVLGRNSRCSQSVCISGSQITGALALLVVFPVSGTIGIISSLKSNKRRRKVVDIYNENYALGYEDKKEYELGFGISQSGVGLVMTF